MTFEQRLGDEEEEPDKHQVESFPNRGNNSHKVPEVDVCPVCSETARPAWLRVVGEVGSGARGGGGCLLRGL